jgi:hypothetical protein
MSSDRKSNLKLVSKAEAARVNGAKSRGPATPEGRAKSSRNSLRHGLSAKSVLLPAESHEQFQLLLDAHIQQFQPANPVEMDLVEAMAVARWRLRRIWAIETSLLGPELERRAEDMDEEFTEMSADDRLAWVFQKLADNNQSLSLLARYEGNLNRAFDRAFKQLNLLQAASRRTNESQRQNEPKVNLPSGVPNHDDLPQSFDSHDHGYSSDSRGDLSVTLCDLPQRRQSTGCATIRDAA